MIIFKSDLFDRLREAGCSVQQIRYRHLIGQATLSKIRRNESISTRTLDILCRLLDCQPGDIIEYIPDPADLDPSESDQPK